MITTEKQILIDAVIESLMKDFNQNDYTVLEELLSFIPDENLIQSLPEEQWKDFEHDDYFKVVKTGYNVDLQREEIQIHAGENGNIFLIKTDEGFIVDVYNQTEEVNTMAIWEEQLIPDDELSDEEIVFNECEEIYNNGGKSAVIDHVEEQMKKRFFGNLLYKDVVYTHCTPCESDTPHLNGVCLVCGTWSVLSLWNNYII